MIIIYFILSVLLSAFIEKIRIKKSWGKVLNINHRISVVIAAALFIISIVVSGLFHWQIVFLALAYIGCRGTLYDPILNLFLGRYIDAESDTTNSKTDRIERKRKIPFWMQRFMYLVLWIASYLLYLLSLKLWP